MSNELMKTLKLFPKQDMEKCLFDKWSLKDIVAHITAWDERDIYYVDALLNNKEPNWVIDIDKFNNDSVDASKNTSWVNVFSKFKKTNKRMLKAYKGLPENFVNKKFWKSRKFTPYNNLEGTIHHYRDEHLKNIVEKLNQLKKI